MFYAIEHGHPFSVIDEETGQKRKAFAGELTQPQFAFILAAKEQRKKMRHENSESVDTPSTNTSNTTHIG